MVGLEYHCALNEHTKPYAAHNLAQGHSQIVITSIAKDHCFASLTTAANLLMIRFEINTSVRSSGDFSTEGVEPVSSTYGWATVVGSLHRVFFALFMGLPALLLLVLLWTLSVPLMAANIVVWWKKVRSTLRTARSS